MPELLPLSGQTSCFEIEKVGEATLVTFSTVAIWDDTTVQMIGKQLVELLEKGIGRQFILNLSALPSQVSLIVAKLIGFNRRVVASGGQVAFCSVDPELHGFFERTQLTRLFRIFPTAEEALQEAAPLHAANGNGKHGTKG